MKAYLVGESRLPSRVRDPHGREARERGGPESPATRNRPDPLEFKATRRVRSRRVKRRSTRAWAAACSSRSARSGALASPELKTARWRRRSARGRRSEAGERRRESASRLRATRAVRPRARSLWRSTMPTLAELAGAVREAGGVALGAYREPLSGKPLLARGAAARRRRADSLPARSLADARQAPRREDRRGRHLPRPDHRRARGERRFWTPNGATAWPRRRCSGMRHVTALVSPDEQLAYRILALNTEKAHNLRDRAMEVIRMARALAKREPKAKELDYAAHFESAELLDARHRLRERVALRGRRLRALPAQGGSLLRSHARGEPARARGPRGAAARDRRSRSQGGRASSRSAASSRRTCAPSSSRAATLCASTRRSAARRSLPMPIGEALTRMLGGREAASIRRRCASRTSRSSLRSRVTTPRNHEQSDDPGQHLCCRPRLR